MESTEKWLPVVGYEGFYEVSDHGRVRSLDRVIASGARRFGRVMRQSPNKGGYCLVSLTVNSISKGKLVHRLVATAFLGLPGEGMEVCHNNGNPSDNRLGNLRWGTKRDNCLDQVRHGTHKDARRVFCNRGHLLAHPNLVLSQLTQGKRRCRACDRARGVARFHGTPLDPEYAHAAYTKIMAQ